MPLNLCEVQELVSNTFKILGSSLTCSSGCAEGAREGPAGNFCG